MLSRENSPTGKLSSIGVALESGSEFQNLQYPLIKEYTLSSSRIPNMISGKFLN